MSTDQNYEQTAQYYDAAYGAVPSLGPDSDLYQKLAVESGGPVLELGCGTGRVLLPIALRGIPCAGVDKSPAMLTRLREKPGAASVELSCSDMASFDFGAQRFRLIFSAFRAFQHLDTVERQLACLARVRAHLEPGGLFAFDVFNPKLERMAADREPEVLDVTFAHNGRRVRRYVSVTRDRATQLMQVTMRYEEDNDAGAPRETAVVFSMRWYWRYELEHLLYRAGFGQVVIYGDFERSPIRPDSPAYVVLAR